MPPQALSATTRAKLRAASPAAVEAATARLARYLRRQRWLGANNRYLRRTVKTVRADAKAPQNADPKHLGEYIAVSAVLHAADGWAYLGRAVGAQCRGDTAVARHLGYYAELRAALGLLSTQGIAVFSRSNVVLKQAGAVEFFPGPTHLTTWQALEDWSDSPGGATLLSTVVRPAGITLADWVSGLGLGTGAWSPLGREWLRAWGLDLRMLGRDQDTRNEASYRPTTLRSVAGASTTDAGFVQAFWPLFEPAPGDPFRELDRHLLRLTLERAFQSTVGRAALGNADFRQALRRTLQANAGVELTSPIGRFLTRAAEAPTPPLFEEAAQRASHLDPNYHAHVISRAALLLRVATGACIRLLSQAQIAPAHYRFWAENLAENHGISEVGALPSDPTDLWADVDDALAGFSESIRRGNDRSFFSLLTDAATAIEVLTGCERVAIWGLAV